MWSALAFGVGLCGACDEADFASEDTDACAGSECVEAEPSTDSEALEDNAGDVHEDAFPEGSSSGLEGDSGEVSPPAVEDFGTGEGESETGVNDEASWEEDDSIALEDEYVGVEDDGIALDDEYVEEEGGLTFEGEPLLAAGIPAGAWRQVKRPLGTTAAKQGYYEYLPPSYGTSKAPSPLLVFLHGLGENGSGSSADLDKVLKNGPPLLIKSGKWDSTRPFVVLSPQQTGGGCPTADQVNAFLTYAIDKYNVDPKRIYLTGLSCGAYGVWNYLGKYRNKHVKAAVPIAGSGVGAINSAGCNLGTVPIWAFHGDADKTVNVSGTTTPVSKLQACYPKPEASSTIYPGVGHDSWSRTYSGSAGHDIYSWLLKHK